MLNRFTQWSRGEQDAAVSSLETLVGEELDSVGIVRFAVHLHFGQRFRILVESDIECSMPDSSPELCSSGVDFGKALPQLLGEEVSSVQISRDGELRLAFANGAQLSISPNNGQYESYQVYLNGAAIIVV